MDKLTDNNIRWDKYGCPDRCQCCGNNKLDTINHQWVCYNCGTNFIQYSMIPKSELIKGGTL